MLATEASREEDGLLLRSGEKVEMNCSNTRGVGDSESLARESMEGEKSPKSFKEVLVNAFRDEATNYESWGTAAMRIS